MIESNRGHLEMEQFGHVTLVRFTDEKILVGETIQTIAGQLHRIVTERARPKLMLDFTSSTVRVHFSKGIARGRGPGVGRGGGNLPVLWSQW